jgi:broad specificity phosphatase PhoE
VDDNLTEWDYGEYEGRTTADIRRDKPEWSIWTTTVHGGETVHQVAGRAHMVIDRAVAAGGRVALFSHAHLLRIEVEAWRRDLVKPAALAAPA